MKKTYLTIFLVLVLLVLSVLYFGGGKISDTAGDKIKDVIPGGGPVACTMEAKMCPDGSFVGRQGPNCEFAACPNPEVKPEIKTDTQSKNYVGVGETKTVNGVSITVNKIVEDSRCPANANCVWAGRVVANVTLKSGTTLKTLDLASDSAPKALGDLFVSIMNVSPNKTSGNPIAPSDYKLTFKVESSQ